MWKASTPKTTTPATIVLTPSTAATAIRMNLSRISATSVKHQSSPSQQPAMKRFTASHTSKSGGTHTRTASSTTSTRTTTLSCDDHYKHSIPSWQRIERKAFADRALERTEVLWLNPRTNEALAATETQQALFTSAPAVPVNQPTSRPLRGAEGTRTAYNEPLRQQTTCSLEPTT